MNHQLRRGPKLSADGMTEFICDECMFHVWIGADANRRVISRGADGVSHTFGPPVLNPTIIIPALSDVPEVFREAFAE